MGKKWFTNGVRQILAEECPDGFRPGRLPVSDETRQKHSEHNAWKSMTDEQKAKRAKKISETIGQRTEEEKAEYAKKMSEARKGKGIGNVPWNKGLTGKQQAWNKGLPMTDEQKEVLRRKYEELSEEEKERRRKSASTANKGKTPWNKGLSYALDPETVKEAKKKETQTRKDKGNYGSSKLEERLDAKLVGLFGRDATKRQYFDELRYPFACDFYLEPLDLFIEVNGNWTHGGMPYEEADELCQAQLRIWKQKAEESSYYENAIYTWTDLDVRKRNAALQNNLSYLVLYTEKEIDDFCDRLADVVCRT